MQGGGCPWGLAAGGALVWTEGSRAFRVQPQHAIPLPEPAACPRPCQEPSEAASPAERGWRADPPLGR